MSLTSNYDGYYDDNGNWQSKRCFVSCGNRCTCSPPGGLYYSKQHDKRLIKNKSDKKEI